MEGAEASGDRAIRTARGSAILFPDGSDLDIRHVTTDIFDISYIACPETRWLTSKGGALSLIKGGRVARAIADRKVRGGLPATPI